MTPYHDRLFHGLQEIVTTQCLPSWDTWILCRYYRCPATIVSHDLTLWMKCMGTGIVNEMPTCQEKILVFDRNHKISPRQSSQD